VAFVRDYQKIDGFWLLSREEAVSAVRVYGKETLTIDYQDYAVNGVGAVRAVLTSGQQSSTGIAAVAGCYGQRDLRRNACCQRFFKPLERLSQWPVQTDY
jgi:hypothetical protein